jgi:hypothetical protein
MKRTWTNSLKTMTTCATLGVALTQVAPVVAFASTSKYYSTGQVVMNGSTTSKPVYIMAHDPSDPTGQPVAWVPLYYLQSAMKQVDIHTAWNGRDLQFTLPSTWMVNTATTVNRPLAKNEMDFVVGSQRYQPTPRLIAKDPASGLNTTYVPVSYVDQFLTQVLSMQATWAESHWTMVTPQALVPQSIISSVMQGTSEVQFSSEHFTSFGTQVVTSDGQGGFLAAIGASRFPTADGLGQLVFFFHNGKIVGLNSNTEVTAIQSIQADGVDKFTVTYANYKPTDAMVSPSLPPQTVTYMWDGTKFVASAPLASGVKSGNVQVTHSW